MMLKSRHELKTNLTIETHAGFEQLFSLDRQVATVLFEVRVVLWYSMYEWYYGTVCTSGTMVQYV